MDISVVQMSFFAAIAAVVALIFGRRWGRSQGGDSLLRAAEVQSAELARLRGVFEERGRLESEANEAMRRIERLVAGSFTRGQMGENVLRDALCELPASMLVRDMAIGGRVCELALRMSDGRLLPIDSKATGLEAVERMSAAEGREAKESVRKQIDSAVASRLKEVIGYIDPEVTIPLAVVAVPDSVYACCRKAHAEAQRRRLALVPYSMAMPYLLSVWHLYQDSSADLDQVRLARRIQEALVDLETIGEKVETQLSRGLTMASNAAAEIRARAAQARSTLSVTQDDGEKQEPSRRIEAV